MTIDLALEYIPRRMAELGHGDNYHIRFRHLVLQTNETLEIEAFTQIYLLVEEAVEVSVTSEMGVFDLSTYDANELVYEHLGTIVIRNLAAAPRHVRFIQVIPKQ